MKAKDKLRANWSKKERDLVFHYPLGVQTVCDAGYLAGVITEELLRELERRGYDKTTFKFSIEPKKGDERFGSQDKESVK